MYYRSDGRGRKIQPAKAIGDGVYQATVEADMSATYYVFVGAPSLELKYSDQPFLSLIAMPAPEPATQETDN